MLGLWGTLTKAVFVYLHVGTPGTIFYEVLICTTSMVESEQILSGEKARGEGCGGGQMPIIDQNPSISLLTRSNY